MVGFVCTAVLVLTSIWVFADARRLGAKRGGMGGGLLDASAVQWLIGCLLVWALIFPIYLFIVRRRLLRARRARETWASPGYATYGPTPDPNRGATWPSPGQPGYPSPAVGSQPFWYQYEPIEQPRPARARQVLGAVVAGALVAGLIGWRVLVWVSDAPSQPNDAQPLVPTSPASTPTQSAAAGRLALVLEQVALRTSDFGAGYTMVLQPDGDQVAGQVTLDDCGYNFTTEAHRIARRQYSLVDSGGQVGISNELVAYDSAREARLALRQWHKATAHCPRYAVKSTVAGMPAMKERVTRNLLHTAKLPNKRNVLTIESGKAAGRPTLFLTTIIQVRGRILDGVYVTDAKRPAGTEVRAALHLASVTGLRLHSQS